MPRPYPIIAPKELQSQISFPIYAMVFSQYQEQHLGAFANRILKRFSADNKPNPGCSYWRKYCLV